MRVRTGIAVGFAMALGMLGGVGNAGSTVGSAPVAVASSALAERNEAMFRAIEREHGLTPQPTTRAELTAFMKKESTQWATIIKERKLTAD